jgi:hypothetical protein
MLAQSRAALFIDLEQVISQLRSGRADPRRSVQHVTLEQMPHAEQLEVSGPHRARRLDDHLSDDQGEVAGAIVVEPVSSPLRRAELL